MLSALLVTLSGPWDAGQRATERAAQSGVPGVALPPGEEAAVPLADPVLAPLGGVEAGQGGGEAGAAGALPAEPLERLLTDPALGDGAKATVVDLASGTELYAVGADEPVAPASTTKLVTAVAALDALGPDHRLTTRTVWDAENDRVVLIGGGDTTLSPHGLGRLAEDTAEALAERGVEAVGVGYDLSHYSGTDQHPIGINDNIASLTPLQVNAGRLDDSRQGPAPRAADPAAAAAGDFVARLADAGVDVRGASAARRTAPADADTLATRYSAPVSTLVERMLTYSDNDLAEALARNTARASGYEPDADGVREAITARLVGLDLPLDGVRIADASGLDRDGRLTTRLLTQLLATSAAPGHEALRSALTGMPVAGFTGTLSGRYPDDGAGLVRAKTGTLTGVNALAGTVTAADGRVLGFAFLVTDSMDQSEAEGALDRAAAALSAVGSAP